MSNKSTLFSCSVNDVSLFFEIGSNKAATLSKRKTYLKLLGDSFFVENFYSAKFCKLLQFAVQFFGDREYLHAEERDAPIKKINVNTWR